MVSPSISGRVAIINGDDHCRCLNCLASLGSAILTYDLLVVVTRDAGQLPPLLKKAGLVVEAHESTKVTVMRVTRAINDLVLSEDPQSDDLIHPDTLMPHVSRLISQKAGHG